MKILVMTNRSGETVGAIFRPPSQAANPRNGFGFNAHAGVHEVEAPSGLAKHLEAGKPAVEICNYRLEGQRLVRK